MEKLYSAIELKKKILTFEEELNCLLYTESPRSREVLKLSEKLDNLIAEYYRINKAPKTK